MKAEEQREQSPDEARQLGRQLDALVARRLLEALGRRADGHRAQVRRLWEGHYRVNLLAGDDAASTRIAASYFVVVDDEGSILASTPEITRRH